MAISTIKKIPYIAFTLLLASCGEEPYRLDSKDRIIVDTTSNHEIQRIIPALEDSCKARFEANVKYLTDSLVEYQIKEIDKKLHQNK